MKKMKYKAVIFDLDGVLCSTDKYHYAAWKKTADMLGIPFNEEINNRLRGISRRESFEIILEGYNGTLSNEEKEKYIEEKNNIYRKLLENVSSGDLDPDAVRTMDSIRKTGVKLAIGSSSKNTKLILHQLGLEEYFDAVSDGTNITRSKPDPEVFLKAAEFLHIAPKDCLVVEDAKAGVEAAKAGGMDCAAVGDAKKYGTADYDLERLSDLINIAAIQ